MEIFNTAVLLSGGQQSQKKPASNPSGPHWVHVSDIPVDNGAQSSSATHSSSATKVDTKISAPVPSPAVVSQVIATMGEDKVEVGLKQTLAGSILKAVEVTIAHVYSHVTRKNRWHVFWLIDIPPCIGARWPSLFFCLYFLEREISYC